MNASPHPAPRSRSRLWFILAGIAAIVAIVSGIQWWNYEQDQANGAQLYHFQQAEDRLTRPPFDDITASIEVDKYRASPDAEDIVKTKGSIGLYETTTFKLKPLLTGGSGACSASNVYGYEVLVDAPGFTVDRIGDAFRSRQALLASACSLSPKAPPTAAPWVWNVMPTRPGTHVVTLLLLAVNKHRDVVDSNEIDIPVYVQTPPEPLSADIGVIAVIVGIVTSVIGLWQHLRRKPQTDP
ncbi:MAG: hypothetical protein JO113_05495 [Candidatus Eremiobacteraeota bacterium]|nr:hypothetical protein [Candidatus Eremiobacteraeota bacterium]